MMTAVSMMWVLAAAQVLFGASGLRVGHDAAAARHQVVVEEAAATSRRSLLQIGVVAAAGVCPPPNALAEEIIPEYALCGSRIPREILVNTPVLNKTAEFLVKACAMSVVATAQGSITLAYGPTQLFGRPAGFLPGVSSFDQDGGHVAIVLREAATATSPGDAVAYIQLAVDNVRASTVMRYGGEIVEAYGAIDVLAPGGLPIRLLVGDEVRDRAMYIALKVASPPKSADFYVKSLGMRRAPYPRARKVEGAFDPNPPKSAIYLHYCDDTFGVLLLQSKINQRNGNAANLDQGNVYNGLRIGNLDRTTTAKMLTDPNGYAFELDTPII